MDEDNEKKQDSTNKSDDKNGVQKEDKSLEEKLKESEDKLLRSLAEIENQRRRFEKEIKDAFEFGSFNFAKESLAILDNLQRAKSAIKNETYLKKIELKKLIQKIRNLIQIYIKPCRKLRMKVKTLEAYFKKFNLVIC